MTAHPARDWKVSTAHRILVRVGWAAMALAVYFAVAAAVLSSVAVWWLVAGIALGVLAITAGLPGPVPDDYLDSPTTVDPLHPRRPRPGMGLDALGLDDDTARQVRRSAA